MGTTLPYRAWQRHATLHPRRGLCPLPQLEPELCQPCLRDPQVLPPASPPYAFVLAFVKRV